MVNQYPSVYLPRETAEWLENYCNQTDADSRNSIVVDAIDYYREHHPEINGVDNAQT